MSSSLSPRKTLAAIASSVIRQKDQDNEEGNRINSNIDQNNSRINEINSNRLLREIYKLENDMLSLVHKNKQNEKSLLIHIERLQTEVRLKDTRIKELEIMMTLEKLSHLDHLEDHLEDHYQKTSRANSSKILARPNSRVSS